MAGAFFNLHTISIHTKITEPDISGLVGVARFLGVCIATVVVPLIEGLVGIAVLVLVTLAAAIVLLLY